MRRLRRRLDYLINSTPGLLLTATGWIALTIALLGSLSAPMQGLLGLSISLPEAERVGRIILVYHALAVPFLAAITYLVLDVVHISKHLARSVRRAITPGYMLTSLGALAFAYLGRNWIWHGLMLVGLSLVFYAGMLLAIGLWPGRHANEDPAYAHLASISLERVGFFVVAISTLSSVLIGASAGAFFGNGFDAVLAEDIVRAEHDLGELAVISHLHIMLALIDVAIFLLIVRRFDLKGPLHKMAMPLTIVGTVVMSTGCWAVMIWEPVAHTVIYAGSSLVLLAALLMTIAGIDRLVEKQVTDIAVAPATPRQRVKALLRDPLLLGPFFQMIWLQFVLVFPGLYTAVKLDEVFRAWPVEAERRILVGHWHILATLSATIVLFLVADRLDVRGWMRRVLGWGVIIGSDLAFTFGAVYEFLPPGADRDWTIPFLDFGLGITLVVLALFLGRRLINLLFAGERWAAEEG